MHSRPRRRRDLILARLLLLLSFYSACINNGSAAIQRWYRRLFTLLLISVLHPKKTFQRKNVFPHYLFPSSTNYFRSFFLIFSGSVHGGPFLEFLLPPSSSSCLVPSSRSRVRVFLRQERAQSSVDPRLSGRLHVCLNFSFPNQSDSGFFCWGGDN